MQADNSTMQQCLHAFQTPLKDLFGILLPEVLVEQFQAYRTLVSFLAQALYFCLQIDHAFSNHDPVWIGLGSRWFSWMSIIDMVVTDPIDRNGLKLFRGRVTVPVMKGI